MAIYMATVKNFQTHHFWRVRRSKLHVLPLKYSLHYPWNNSVSLCHRFHCEVRGHKSSQLFTSIHFATDSCELMASPMLCDCIEVELSVEIELRTLIMRTDSLKFYLITV